MRSIDFSEDNLGIQWQYVKRNLRELGIMDRFVDFDLEDDFEAKVRGIIQNFIQESIYHEFTLQIGADRYERAQSRLSTRKGEYERFLTTTFGTSQISIPRARGDLKIDYKLFDKYQRRHEKFDNMVILSMLLGFSTRKQRKFFRAFIGDAVSQTTASKLLKKLEEGLKEFRTRPIEDKYKYLIIDGLWVKVKEEHIQERVILFILGITLDNKKEIIGFKLAKGESEEEVAALLNDLYRRGLEGKYLKLISSDRSKGIRSAINMVYPYAKWQLCYVHKLRNLSKNIRHKQRHRKRMMGQATEIYKASSKIEAIKRFNRFYLEWQGVEPYAVKCFQEDFYETLAYFDFQDDKNLISTTNHLERDLEEVRRRIKIQGYFKSERSLNLWVYGIISLFRVDKSFTTRREEERQPKVMPDYAFHIKKEPKYQSAHFS
jgi:putative transposase